eukprot:m.32083 g.32083  ORF g.32083 m.32083 type:complete len:355 (+) comp12121_c0_seq1:42-1106(+)
MANVGKIDLSVTVTHETSATIDIQGFSLLKKEDPDNLYLKVYLVKDGEEIKISKQKTATLPKNFIFYLNHLVPGVSISALSVECSIWKAPSSLSRHQCLGGCSFALATFPSRSYRLFSAEDRKNPASPCSPLQSKLLQQSSTPASRRISVVRRSSRMSVLRAMSVQDLRRKRSHTDLNESADSETGESLAKRKSRSTTRISRSRSSKVLSSRKSTAKVGELEHKLRSYEVQSTLNRATTTQLELQVASLEKEVERQQQQSELLETKIQTSEKKRRHSTAQPEAISALQAKVVRLQSRLKESQESLQAQVASQQQELADLRDENSSLRSQANTMKEFVLERCGVETLHAMVVALM